MNDFLKYNNLDEIKLQNLILDVFKDKTWARVFIDDSHHGFTHGNQVRLASFKLIKKLNPQEKEKLAIEWKEICENNFHEASLVSIGIAAIFHDCGRFNDNGEIIAEEQKHHNILSAKRAKIFCENIGLTNSISHVKEAVICHDFQSQKLTPHLNPPSTIIGKIIQSSDQMGWLHPASINRTLAYNKALGRPFMDPDFTLEERLTWQPGTVKDALTVMLHQLHGSTEIDRFGIEFARKKAENYKVELEKNILKIADEFNLENEVKKLIREFWKNLWVLTWNLR